MYERGAANIADLREAGVPEERIRELVEEEGQDASVPPLTFHCRVDILFTSGYLNRIFFIHLLSGKELS
jgi:hypothetical protein